MKGFNKYCYVCGFDFKKDNAVFVPAICPCCYYQYVMDGNFMKYRQDWIKSGMPFLKEPFLSYSLSDILNQFENLKNIDFDYNYSSEAINWTRTYSKEEIIQAWEKIKK